MARWTGSRSAQSVGGMSAVPVAVRRIRRRAWAKEIESGSRSAAAEARAVSALIAWWTIR